LAATASSSAQIGLAWAASTDNVGVTGYLIERCSGASCTTFTQIASVSGTSTTYSDLGLTASTSYSYRVRATDAAKNLSGYSNISSATTQSGGDTTPPSAPSNLAATASSSTQIGLNWTASTDNVGVTGYRIERCAGASCSSFTQIATVGSTTSYSDTSLTASTSYSYRVRANDAAGNLSGYSNVSSATTPSAPDTTPPSAPSGFGATAASPSQINLNWTASTDNVGVTGYLIESCSGSSCSSFTQIASVNGTTTTYSNTGLTASTSYSYRVRATDAANNLSPYSNTASATTPSSGGSGITISVSPKRGGLTTSQSLSITATLSNDTGSQGANWSFTSTGSTSGGSFSAPNTPSGIPVQFTAPISAGVVTITATAVGDGTKTATATIGVTDLAGVTTYLNGNSRQGTNTQEYALTTSGTTAVNATNFGKLFSCQVDAAIYPQPLWAANLSFSGVKHNVVFVATEHDTIYAFDADNNSCSVLWSASLIDTNHGGSPGETWVSFNDVMGCTDTQPDIGVIGTPVIDPVTSTLYVVSKSGNSGTFFQRIHALDITTGNEKFSGPQMISATVSGTGAGSSGGNVSFDPLGNNQRPALLLTNGHVIIAWGSHCDNMPYHGWVMSYSASSLAREAALNVSPNGVNAGIWMSGNGPAADSSGNIYLATGNGTFDADTSGVDYGDSILKIAPPSGGSFGPVSSYFRGNTIISPDGADFDQGSGGVMLFPTVAGSKNYLVQAGKDGIIYVMDSASLGGYNSSSNNVVEELSGGAPGGMWGSPSYWNGSVFFGPAQDEFGSSHMIAYSLDTVNTATLSTSSTSQTSFSFAFPGPTSSVSSNGATNGVVWSLENQAYCTPGSSGCGPAVLHAYDATNLANEFWNSSQGSGNTAGNAVKFTVPTVANGKVYVGTRGNNFGDVASSTPVPGELDVYGLLP
jgi:hypothetical protein